MKVKFSKSKIVPVIMALAAIAVAIAGVYLWAGRTVDGKEAGPTKAWAIAVELDGLPNFHKVTEDLYRGAQPTAEGISQLKKLGIKTIVNLRAAHSDRDEIGQTDIGYEHIRVEPWDIDKDEIVRFLRIVSDKEKAPVFVHCQHGSDRTGLMCAIYRVAVCGWSKEAAADEMVNGGFGFHPIWKNIISTLESLDIESIKQNSELISPTAVQK